MSFEPRIGIDLGGTKIEGVIVTGPPEDLAVLTRKRIPTEADRGFDHILGRVEKLVLDLARELDLERPFRLGMGMPGSLTRDGRVKNSNTVCLNGTIFRQELVKKMGQKIEFANDADCFTLAESIMGAGQDYDMVFGVIMGTGVGGGIAYKQHIRQGPQSTAGEWGHMVLRPEGADCYCGKKGCVETLIAGPWIEKQYRELSGEQEKLATIVEKYKQGDEVAKKCVAVWLDNYGRALGNVLNVLDPDVVVLGGGVSNADFLYTEGRDYVTKYVFSDTLETPIVKNRLGDSAGVLGAALLV